MEHAKALGVKVAMIPSHVRRPLPGAGEPDPLTALAPAPWARPGWLDTFGLDSEHDYDPMWARAVELGLPLSSHSSGMGMTDRSSITNSLFNQIGHFGSSGAALAKSLFLGGVTHRFPGFRVAMLEEAYELLERGVVDEATLRDFLFTNGVRFLTDMNPDFFAGTVIEREVLSALGRASPADRPASRRSGSPAPSRTRGA